MILPAEVSCGVSELHRLLQEQTYDLRRLDLAGFRDWLSQQLVRWQWDPVFVQRCKIRDLRQAHPHLHSLEQEHRRALVAEKATPSSQRLRQLDRELINTDKAIAGISAALEQAPPAKRRLLGAKLEAFQVRGQALQGERATLIQANPERQVLLRSCAALHEYRAAIGLDQEEVRLSELMHQQGHHAGRTGRDFEELALAITQRLIVPELLEAGPGTDASTGLRVLRKVTLGAARVEFDEVVVRLSALPEQPVDVLAVVEVKRNLNDLAHGFRHRQENLAWLSGAATRYDPGLYRTRQFRTGHFEGEAVHQQDGQAFRFARPSFRRFQSERDSEQLLDRLYFITRAGPLWGVSAATLARLSFRVAMDERWDLANDSYLGKLLRWCQSLANPIETPDMLRMYSSSSTRARQMLLVDRSRSDSLMRVRPFK